MIQTIRLRSQWALPAIAGMCLLILLACTQSANALTPIPEPDPQPGSYGLEATKRQPPPTRAPSIATPGNGGSFTTSPITVTGICQTDLLVQVYNNDVMVGAVICKGGSFSLKVSLFAGKNELSAIMYDDLGQPGPKSKVVTVTYNNAQFTSFGELITLTSSYGRRSAAAGSPLRWPLQLSGGTGPYAFSLDWGDGSSTELKSQPITGLLTVAHTYKKAGIHQANVRVTDVNGVSAFLQVVAVANGKVDTPAATEDDKSDGASKPTVLWIPTAVSIAFLIPAFWLGRLSQLTSIRNKMLKERDSYKQK